jgi:two-component system, OmpR family, sensor histidine kinase CiaH
MASPKKKLQFIFIIYWVLLAYIIAALVWWFIALNRQNNQMTSYKLSELKLDDPNYIVAQAKLLDAQKRKTAQYIGEGLTFFLLIVAGAVFVFRAVRNQLLFSRQQQNFMMALTHELKTPIAVASLNLQTLQKRQLDEPQRQKLIQNTLQEANRLNSLCNNMLLSSQIDAKGYELTNEEINFSELVNSSLNDFNTRFSTNKYSNEIAPNLFVIGDRMLLQIAVNNLLDNAIKYSAKDSEITVALSNQNNKIQLQIKDTGKGISAEEKTKIFQKFYRVGNNATKAAKGTGLGLYLTKKIVDEHKGNIFVTDNKPNGSIFVLELN